MTDNTAGKGAGLYIREEGIEKEQEVIEISEENLENLDIEIDL